MNLSMALHAYTIKVGECCHDIWMTSYKITTHNLENKNSLSYTI